MMLFNCFVFVLIAAEIRAAAIAFEESEDGVYPVILTQVREKRSPFPGRAMMFHGYFGSAAHPYQGTQNGYDRHNGRSYDPQGAMSAFASGDSVTAGSSYYGNGGGNDCSNCGVKKVGNGNGNGNGKKNGNGHSNGNGKGNGYPTNGNGYHHHHEEPSNVPATNGNPENAEPQPTPEPTAVYPNGNGNGAENEVPQENGGEDGYLGDQPAAEETPKGETLPPAEPTQAVATPEAPRKVPDESDEEEEEPSYFSHKGRGRVPYYNSYFPMVFGAYPGYGGGRGGNREEGGAYNPGVATAIANSFSTGKGAVATSHATAYGGPQFVPTSYRKNGSRTRNHS